MGSSRSSSLDEDARSIDSNEESSTLEADVVEIDFVASHRIKNSILFQTEYFFSQNTN
mgnify:CR=1 FL=1